MAARRDVVVSQYAHYYEPGKLTPDGVEHRDRQFNSDLLLYGRAQHYESAEWKGEIQVARRQVRSRGRMCASGERSAGKGAAALVPAEYTKRMESVFEIIAEPNRRAILSLLVSSQQSVGEIERQLRMPQPTVSKHLRVLREAGFVEATVDAQRRLYRLKPEPLQEVDAWLAPFRQFWSAHVDALERHLDRMEQSTATKRKTRRRK